MHAITLTLLEIVTTQVHGYARHVITPDDVCHAVVSSFVFAAFKSNEHTIARMYMLAIEHHQDICNAMLRPFLVLSHVFLFSSLSLSVTEMRHKLNRIYIEIMDIVALCRSSIFFDSDFYPRELTFAHLCPRALDTRET